MKQFRTLWPYLLFEVLMFGFLPFLAVDTGSAIVILLIVFPAMCFFIGLWIGFKHGFLYWYPICTCLFFLLTIPLFYKMTAWPYSPIFGILAFSGLAIAYFIRKITAK